MEALARDKLHDEVAVTLFLKKRNIVRQIGVLEVLENSKLALEAANVGWVERLFEGDSHGWMLEVFSFVDGTKAPIANHAANAIVTNERIGVMDAERKTKRAATRLTLLGCVGMQCPTTSSRSLVSANQHRVLGL